MLEEYYQYAKLYASENTVFMLLGNKCDLEPVVSTDQGLEAALRLGALYLEVSTKDNHNIKYFFELIAIHIIETLI